MEKTNWTIIAGIAAVLVVFIAVWLSKNSQSSSSVTTITGSFSDEDMSQNEEVCPKID
ncbi:MAG: hypothetical protein J6U79_04290 [Paludibacteraceae bacterium]|nr:hypothetical protein [Paludibacteraceae bacterium]